MSSCLERHGPIDDRDGGTECGCYIQKRGVEQVRVSRFIETAIRIAHVSGIPFFYLVIEGVAINHLATRFQLPRPPFHPRLAVGLDEQFYVGVRADDRADVTPVQDGTVGLGGKSPLVVEQRLSHRSDDSDLRGQVTDLGREQKLRLDVGLVEVFRRSNGADFELVLALIGLHGAADGAIEQAGIEVRQRVVPGEARGQRALARSGGSIHGNDHLKVLEQGKGLRT